MYDAQLPFQSLCKSLDIIAWNRGSLVVPVHQPLYILLTTWALSLHGLSAQLHVSKIETIKPKPHHSHPTRYALIYAPIVRDRKSSIICAMRRHIPPRIDDTPRPTAVALQPITAVTDR